MNYVGMNANYGRAISDIEHIWQSCRDIINTPIGSRIERRDYGSLYHEMVDQPHNQTNNMRLMAATVIALAKWEPRIAIRNINIYLGENQGETMIDMDAIRTDGIQAGNPVALNIPMGGIR